MKKCAFICEKDGIGYFLYKPNIFRIYAKCYSRDEKPPYFSRVIHHIRMIRELLFAHYVVIYLKKEDHIVGHLVVGRGGTRIAMSNKNDIVIGPIWIVPSERGNGIASKAIYHVLHSLGFDYVYAYEYIDRSNIASIRTVEKNGFEFVSNCTECGVMRTIKESDFGSTLVYRYRGKSIK